MFNEWSDKSKAFLEEKRLESEAFMKKFQEMKAKQDQNEALAQATDGLDAALI